jgi:hypothetical protein
MAGHRLLRSRVEVALDRAIEAPEVDFKRSAPWDALKYKIVKASMGMGNLRDGGILVVGVAEEVASWVLEGISDANLSTYDSDVMKDLVNRFVSPAARFEAVRHSRDSRQFGPRVPRI